MNNIDGQYYHPEKLDVLFSKFDDQPDHPEDSDALMSHNRLTIPRSDEMEANIDDERTDFDIQKLWDETKQIITNEIQLILSQSISPNQFDWTKILKNQTILSQIKIKKIQIHLMIIRHENFQNYETLSPSLQYKYRKQTKNRRR